MRHIHRIFLASLLATGFAGALNADEAQAPAASTSESHVCLNESGVEGPCTQEESKVRTYRSPVSFLRKLREVGWRWGPDGSKIKVYAWRWVPAR